MSSSLVKRTCAVLARVLGLAALLLCLVVPGSTRASAPEPTTPLDAPAAADDHLVVDDELDGGACGEDDDEVDEEEIDCSIDSLSRFESGLLALVRAEIERLSPDQCKVLLDRLYDQQMCRVEGRECGTLIRFAPLPVAPKLSSSSSSARTLLAWMDLSSADRRLLARAGDDRPLRERALDPPERPPRARDLG